MSMSNVPVPIPERQPESPENGTLRPAGWQREKKPTRFVIKVSGSIPM